FFQAGSFQQEAANHGIRTFVVSTGRLRQIAHLVRSVGQLSALLKQERPHIVLNWSAKTQLYGAPACILAGLAGRLIWWQHSVPANGWMDRLATLLPALAVGCSSRSALLAQNRIWPHRRTFVVYPGVDDAPIVSSM